MRYVVTLKHVDTRGKLRVIVSSKRAAAVTSRSVRNTILYIEALKQAGVRRRDYRLERVES